MLEGTRVLDLTFYLPGPYATLFLADLGAEVIKVENPAGGDPLRGLGPAGGTPAGSVFFQAVNRGKKSLALDLKSPAGRDIFFRLAATADGVVEQFRPGVARRLGVDFDSVRAVNPRLAYVSLSGYGQTGPLAGAAGHDLNYMAQSGLLSLFAPFDEAIRPSASGAVRPPPGPALPLPPIQLADLSGGHLAAIALLAGLLSAHLTGTGSYLDVSMTDGLLSLMTMTAANYLAAGGYPPERPNLFLAGNEPSYNVYRTADGRLLSVGALEWRFWDNLCAVLAANDPEGRAAGAIAPSREEVARIFATKTAGEWLALVEGLDVCVAPVLTMAEALDGENTRARGMVIEAAGGITAEEATRRAGGAAGEGAAPTAAGSAARAGPRQIACPIASPTSFHGPGPGRPPAGPVPRLGQHSREVLSTLGYGQAEIDELARRGVIQGRPVAVPKESE